MRIGFYSVALLILSFMLQFNCLGQKYNFTRSGKSIELFRGMRLIDSKEEIEIHYTDVHDETTHFNELFKTDYLSHEDDSSVFIYMISYSKAHHDTVSVERFILNKGQLSKIKFTKVESYVAGYNLMMGYVSFLTIEKESLKNCFLNNNTLDKEVEKSLSISFGTFEGVENTRKWLQSKMSD